MFKVTKGCFTPLLETEEEEEEGRRDMTTEETHNNHDKRLSNSTDVKRNAQSEERLSVGSKTGTKSCTRRKHSRRICETETVRQ